MEIALEILREIPLWAYLVFVFLLFAGIKASKPRRISLKQMLIAPLVFTAWSLSGLFTHWKGEPRVFLFLIPSLLFGGTVSWLYTRSWKIQIDRKRGYLFLPGTWSTLFFALSIFLAKFGFELYYATHAIIQPEVLLTDAALLGFIAGFFIGRAFFLWQKYVYP